MTIGIALVILLLLTVSTFYVNRFLLFEQKTASNQYRSTQAFEAAEAGRCPVCRRPVRMDATGRGVQRRPPGQ